MCIENMNISEIGKGLFMAFINETDRESEVFDQKLHLNIIELANFLF